MTTHTARPASSRVPVVPALRASQVLSILTVLVILSLGVTGGQLVGSGGNVIDIHGATAIVLHVVAGLAAIALFAYRASGANRSTWPAVLMALVFAYSFYQAWLGSHGPISLHVPGALFLTGASAVVAAWTFLHDRGTSAR